jgi:hypothetical protein
MVHLLTRNMVGLAGWSIELQLYNTPNSNKWTCREGIHPKVEIGHANQGVLSLMGGKSIIPKQAVVTRNWGRIQNS